MSSTSQVALVEKNQPSNAGKTRVQSLGLKIPAVRSGNPLQYSCLENSTDRGLWWATGNGATKSQTRLST